jgi:hypothetical protein
MDREFCGSNIRHHRHFCSGEAISSDQDQLQHPKTPKLNPSQRARTTVYQAATILHVSLFTAKSVIVNFREPWTSRQERGRLTRLRENTSKQEVTASSAWHCLLRPSAKPNLVLTADFTRLSENGSRLSSSKQLRLTTSKLSRSFTPRSNDPFYSSAHHPRTTTPQIHTLRV